MKRHTAILTSILVLTACSTNSLRTTSDLTTTAKKNQPTVIKTGKSPVTTSIFRYYTDPIHHGQSASVVQGKFFWHEGCLYLAQLEKTESQAEVKFYTAIFPDYPKEIVQWDETTKTLTFNGHLFKMGDYIHTNGHLAPYSPKIDIEGYAKQGNSQCILPRLAYIGTSIRENN